MHVMAATVGCAHTIEGVTQTEWAALVRLWRCCAGRVCRLIHGLLQVKPWSNLEVG